MLEVIACGTLPEHPRRRGGGGPGGRRDEAIRLDVIQWLSWICLVWCVFWRLHFILHEKGIS